MSFVSLSSHWKFLMKIANRALLVLAPALCLASHAIAQSNTMDQTSRTGEESEVLRKGEGGTLSLSANAAPDYADSGKSRVGLMPGLEYRWANGFFASTERGVGYNFAKDSALQYGLGLGADMGRRASGALSGMGDVDARIEYAAFLQYAMGRDADVAAALRYGSGNDAQGLVVELGAHYSLNLAPQWKLGFGVGTSWANAPYLQTYFGVTDAQSNQTGFAAYTPTGGFRDVSANLTLSYALTPEISLAGGVSASSLLGEASNSPIVSSGNRVAGSLSIRYAF